MFFFLLSAFISLVRSQTLSYAWSTSTSERNVRVVFAGSSCSGYGRVEVWKNNAWNALSDCFSSSRYFTSTEADLVCEQVGYPSGAVFLGYEFYTSSSVPISLKTGSTAPVNRLYAGTMSCTTSRTTSEFCDGCTISTSTSSTKCSSSVYSSTSSSTSSPGLWSGVQPYNRDVFVDCLGTQSSGTCNSVTGTANLYTGVQIPSAGQCNLTRSTQVTNISLGGAGAAIAGLIILYICLGGCCGLCICGLIVFFVCGGTLAICECMRPKKPRPAASGVVVTSVATTQPAPVVQNEGYAQGTTAPVNATAVGYGQPVGQPVQYGGAPGPQQGYAPQGYAQPVAAGGYAPGYAPAGAPVGGAPPGYGQPAPGGPPAYAPAAGAPGYAPQNPPPY